MELRPSSTLLIPEDLMLPKDKAYRDFMFVYLNRYKQKTLPFMVSVWASALFPNAVADSKFGTNLKSMRAANAYLEKRVPSGLLTLRKVLDQHDPHFYVSIPVFAFADSQDLTNFVSLFSDAVDQDAYNAVGQLPQNDPNLTQRIIPGNKAVDSNPRLSADERANLRNCLIQVRIVQRGGVYIVFMDMRINKAEAQQLAVTPWLELRSIDLYPLILQWVASGFGTRAAARGMKKVRPAAAAFSLSKVSHTLPKDQSSIARSNEFNLSLDPHGREFYLPWNLNDTLLYEDAFTQACTREGSSDFSLLSFDEDTAGRISAQKELHNKLPKNTPVMIDWLNSRYSYTQQNGTLRVQDISRFRKLDVSHALTLLKRRAFSSEVLDKFRGLAAAVNFGAAFKVEASEFEGLKDQHDQPIPEAVRIHLTQPTNVEDYYLIASKAYMTLEGQTDVSWYDISIEGHPFFRPVARWLAEVLNECLQHVQVLNTQYSVTYTAQWLASLTMIVQYTKDRAALKLADETQRAAAINQGIDPNYEVEPIPMAEGIPGFLPHQKKIRNLMKDSPENALLPVQAGGGKTPIGVTDVLIEIKHNRSAPYLIMCPSHLVPQYVSEINHFTKGKLNVIPITSHVIRTHGMDRLEHLIATAPRNTVVVVDYNVLRYKPSGSMGVVCYGTTTIETYPVVMFLRRFNFQYVLCDESHLLKNDSARSRATMGFIVDIPKKRLASGTMAHDSPSDLAIQASMLDPTLLGSREEFNLRYGEEMRGDRVIKWKGGASNAAKMIFNDLKKRVVIAGAMRKEWAAVLPTIVAKYIGVDLTPKQMEVYNTILEQTLEKLREEAKTNPTLAKFFEGKGSVKEALRDSDEEDGSGSANSAEDQKREEDLDEEEGAGLEALLQVHLARLEQFVTAPAKDIIGNQVLQGDDRMSPKVAKVVQLIRQHLEGYKKRNPSTGVEEDVPPHPGKILIFTNYTESAEAIYEQMPEDLKRIGLLYRASEKVEAGAAFENDPRIKWMVGVSQSMDTGLNLQFCSRLIRVETVWNPGTLEQGNARLNRPEFKKNLDRDVIFFDTIVADKTIDITKASRLISKVITVGKFDNQDSHHYDSVPDVEVISMNLDSILEMNSWHGDLKGYMEAHRAYMQAEMADYAEYRVKMGWPEKMTSEDRAKLIQQFERAPDPKDAMFMSSAVYVPGGTVPFDSKLGLIRLDYYLRSEDFASAYDIGEEEVVEGVDNDAKTQLQQAYEALKGTPCHTDMGEGVIGHIYLGGRRMVMVIFPDGGASNDFRMSTVWIPKDPKTKLKDIAGAREKIAAEVGLPKTAEIQTRMQTMLYTDKTKKLAEKYLRVKTEKVKKQKEEKAVEDKKIEKKVKDQISVVLKFVSSNGFLGIGYRTDEKHPDERAVKALQALGFRPNQKYVRAEMKTALMLRRQMQLWSEEGFSPDSALHKMWQDLFPDMLDMLKTGKVRNHISVFRQTSKNQIANFYRMEFKPSSKPNVIRPFPLFEQGKAYIVMPYTGQAGTRAAMQKRAAGVKWQICGHDELMFYAPTKTAIGQKMQEILASGIQVMNLDELMKAATKIKKMRVREVEQEEDDDSSQVSF